MRKIWMVWVLVVSCLGVAGSAFAQWELIQTGFEYRKFTLSGPVEAFVVRMGLDEVTSRAVDSTIAQGQYYKTGIAYEGRETPSAMAARYNDEINFYYQEWGKRNDVIAAINGDYWEREYPGGPYTGRPTGGQIQSGWFARRFDEYAGGSGFFWTIWGAPRLGGDVRNGDPPYIVKQYVFFADASSAYFTKLNIERGTDDLVLYTPQWDGNTHTDNSGVEVLVKVNRPALLIPDGVSANSCTGTVIEVRDGQGSTPIPFDHVVLSGTGTGATTLRNKCQVGDTISLRMHLRDYGFPDRTPPHPAQDTTKAYGSCGVDREVVISSTVTNLPSPDTTRDPRTAVAFNNNYMYFIVVDGRSGISIGMTFAELASFCINSLSATTGASLDGGGSSALWVKGKGIVNHPSDGSERWVCNGMIMVAMNSMQLSGTFREGRAVHTTSSAAVRLGPSTNCDSIATAPVDQQGVILSHSLNGVRAKGQNWWYWQYGSTAGWTSENQLALSPTGSQDWILYE
ncbi:MAG: phosphodiester glycosidase family protein [bacterium]